MEQNNEKTGFSQKKALQVIISILVAIAVWVYVDVEKAPDRTKTIRDIPVEFSGESTTLADKNLMLLSGYDTTVDLTIKGPKRELVKIGKDTVRLGVRHRFRGRPHPAVGCGLSRRRTGLRPVGGLGQQV